MLGVKCFLVSAVSLFGFPLSAQAYSSRCSNPDREMVFGRYEVTVPDQDYLAFEEKMWTFAEYSGMIPAGVGSLEQAEPYLLMIFQSPEVSVAIEVRIDGEKDTAEVKLYRQCINDAVEDWFPYWMKLRAFTSRNFPE